MHISPGLHVALISLSGLVGAYVGLRLLVLARRTGKWPELQVSVALLSWSVLGQPLALCLGPWADGLDPSVLEACYRGYWFSWVVVYTGLACFCRSVFDQNRSRLRGLLFWLSWTPGALAWLVIAAWGTSLGPWPEAICNLTCATGFGWAGAEALIYWRKLVRREQLGLADPVVTNRFLLWGGCCAGTSPIALWVFMLAIQGHGLGSGYAPAEFATSVGGLVNGSVWLLTFVPPAWYIRLIQRRAAPRLDGLGAPS
jgi:hypothetical protein